MGRRLCVSKRLSGGSTRLCLPRQPDRDCHSSRAIKELETNTGTKYEKLYIVGGGAKNILLNRLTEEATGKQVVALPIEATALGN
ncbi:MAG: hypothetical protein E7448_07795 [Ruminococcaceae bacterium]|nr:hypothetical protein [Oscillospiraceae bacterium]